MYFILGELFPVLNMTYKTVNSIIPAIILKGKLVGSGLANNTHKDIKITIRLITCTHPISSLLKYFLAILNILFKMSS